MSCFELVTFRQQISPTIVTVLVCYRRRDDGRSQRSSVCFCVVNVKGFVLRFGGMQGDRSDKGHPDEHRERCADGEEKEE